MNKYTNMTNIEKHPGHDWTKNCESCIHHAWEYFPTFKSHVIACKIFAGRSCGGRVGEYPKYEAPEFIEEEEMTI